MSFGTELRNSLTFTVLSATICQTVTERAKKATSQHFQIWRRGRRGGGGGDFSIKGSDHCAALEALKGNKNCSQIVTY